MITLLRMKAAKHYTIGLIQTVQIRNAIIEERIHRYEGHNSPSHWDEHEPHK